MSLSISFRNEFIVYFLQDKYKIPPELTRKYITNNLSDYIFLKECNCDDLDTVCDKKIIQTCQSCLIEKTFCMDNEDEDCKLYYHYCINCICHYGNCSQINQDVCHKHLM